MEASIFNISCNKKMGSLPGKYTGALYETEIKNLSHDAKMFIAELDEARAKGRLRIGKASQLTHQLL